MVEEILKNIASYNQNSQLQRIEEVFRFVDDFVLKDNSDLAYGYDVLKLLLPLRPDDNLIVATMIYPLFLSRKLDESQLKVFGDEVTLIVTGVRKLESLKYASNDKASQIEILRKMFLSMAKDLRCIVMALAFRLYKVKNVLPLVSDELRIVAARETLDIYVPTAERLGLYSLKIQMEDLAFQYAYPEEYQLVKQQIDSLSENRFPVIDMIKADLEKFLRVNNLKGLVSGRVKSIYSIYKKMKRKNLISLDGVYDIFAMRVVFPTQYDAAGREKVDYLYGFVGTLHSKWRPVSKRFKDYVAVPKPNGYRSLHTVVLGLAPKGSDQPVEIQVRSEAMHAEAQFGVASHWLYKASGSSDESTFSSQIEWLRGLERLSAKAEEGDLAGEVELDLFSDRIFVLTPRGEVKDLPQGSCPIDFAYVVHTDVGHRCVMAKVNSSVVPLDYELQNGDVVQIITRKDSSPKLQWLSMVKTAGARNKIKAWFSQLNRENNIREGRRLINLHLSRLGKDSLDQNYTILRDIGGERLTLSRRETLIEEVGKGSRLVSEVIRKIFPYEDILADKRTTVLTRDGKKVAKDERPLEDKIMVGGEGGVLLKLAACCVPKLGNSIEAYVTKDGRVTIHRSNCTLFQALNKKRKMTANWISRDHRNYRVKIKVRAISRLGLMSDLTSVISKMGISIDTVDIKPDTGTINNDYFVLNFNDPNKFDSLINKLERVQGVLEVKRVD